MTREEAIKALTMQLEYWEQLKKKNVLTDHEGNNVVDVLKLAIEALQAEPVKHGSWTITDTDDGEGGEIPHLICSECKSEPMAWSSKRFFNYCPNCGAKMNKE